MEKHENLPFMVISLSVENHGLLACFFTFQQSDSHGCQSSLPVSMSIQLSQKLN